MTATDIKKALTARYDRDFINLSEIGKCLGMGPDKTREIMQGVDYVTWGRTKRYLVTDVAEKIASMRQV